MFNVRFIIIIALSVFLLPVMCFSEVVFTEDFEEETLDEVAERRDTRLVELKRELAVMESKRLELESAGAKKIEIVRLIDQAVELAGEFKTAFAEGSIDEKRLFIRAFLKKIELDPMTGKGQAMLILMPGMEMTITMFSASSDTQWG